MTQKKTWMLLLTIGVVSSSLLISSCVRTLVEYIYFAHFFYDNESQAKINIEAYGHDDTGNKTIEYLEFKPEDTKEFLHAYNGTPEEKRNFIIDADSLKIIFDDTKHIWYHRTDRDKRYNLLNYDNYTRKEIKVNVIQYNFVFTREMYDLAIETN